MHFKEDAEGLVHLISAIVSPVGTESLFTAAMVGGGASWYLGWVNSSMVVLHCLMHEFELKSSLLKSLFNPQYVVPPCPASSSVLSLVLGIELGTLFEPGKH